MLKHTSDFLICQEHYKDNFPQALIDQAYPGKVRQHLQTVKIHKLIITSCE